MALKNRAHFIFGCGEWQVANVDRRHSTNLTTERTTVAPRYPSHAVSTCRRRRKASRPSHRPCTNFD
jgi:TnpA family transposase